MTEEALKNLFIGISYKNDTFIETLDLNTHINKVLLKDFISEKEKEHKLKNENNVGFCFDCNKNINNSNCDDHSIIYYQEINNNINIKSIEDNFKKIIENYNNVVNILEQKIKDFKKRNNEQILLAKKIINVYISSLKSNNLTYQLILNTQNILHFNDINKEQLNTFHFNFDYNILKAFHIDNYLKESIAFGNIQKVTDLNFNEHINSIIFYEKKNKIIVYSENRIFLLNTLNFAYESKIECDYEIISIILMKDNETILVSHETGINKLMIEDNKIVIKDYLKNVSVYNSGVIINYKNGIAWTCEDTIKFSSKKEFHIFKETNEQYLGKKMNLQLVNLLQYTEDTILYLYNFYDGSWDLNSLHFNIYNSNEKSKYNDIILEKESLDYSDESNNHKIFNFRTNEIIIISIKEINIINIFNWQIINTIYPPKDSRMYNSISLNDFQFLIFFNTGWHRYREDAQEKNNMMLITIKDNYNKIIFRNTLKTDKNGELFYNTFTKNSSSTSQIISILGEKINFYEVLNGIKKTIALELNKPDKK